MTKKIATELYHEMVQKKLYEQEDTTQVLGNKTYIVNTMCTKDEADGEIPQEWSVQAGSPEQAKTAAMAMSAKAQFSSCRVVGVEMVPNSGEELNNYGGGSLNADPSSVAGQVMPSDVADLPNGDAKA